MKAATLGHPGQRRHHHRVYDRLWRRCGRRQRREGCYLLTMLAAFASFAYLAFNPSLP